MEDMVNIILVRIQTFKLIFIMNRLLIDLPLIRFQITGWHMELHHRHVFTPRNFPLRSSKSMKFLLEKLSRFNSSVVGFEIAKI